MGVFSGFGEVSALDLSAADAAPVMKVAVANKAIVQHKNMKLLHKTSYNWR
jgi:hypothetical protein